MLSDETYRQEKSKKDTYYNSLENSFLTYLKNEKIANQIDTIIYFSALISFLITVVNIPSILENIYSFSGMIENYSFPRKESEYKFVHWLIIILVLGITILFWKYTSKLFKYFLANAFNPRSISLKNLTFCHISFAIKELEFFRLDRQNEHLKNAKESFSFYIENSENMCNIKESKDILSIANTVKEFQSSVHWLQLSENSMHIINAYSSLENKVIGRIAENQPLGQLQYILEDLSLSLFARIHMSRSGNHPESSSIYWEIAEHKLISFSKAVNSLTPLDGNIETKKRWLEKFKAIGISNYYSHSNPIILFAIWLTILGISVSLIMAISLALFNISMDSKILIGFWSIVIAGSISLVGITWKKTNK